jgi:hypothetical protein
MLNVKVGGLDIDSGNFLPHFHPTIRTVVGECSGGRLAYYVVAGPSH